MAKQPSPLQQAKQILGAQYAPIDYAATKAAQRSRQETEALNASRAALITLLQGGVKPAGDVYDQAVGQQQALAKGAADLLSQANPNPQIQADLSAVNAPPEQHQLLQRALQAGFPGAGAVLNIDQGAVPGASLVAQKAAQQGYLAGLPTVAALSGEQSLRGLLAKGEDQQNALTEQRLQIGGQLPALVHTLTGEAQSRHQQALDNAYRTSQAQAEAAYRQQDLQFRARQAQLDRAAQQVTTPYQQAQLDLEQRKLDADIKANQPTALDIYKSRTDRINATRQRQDATRKTKSGGLSANETYKYSGQAASLAHVARRGAAAEGTPGTSSYKEPLPPLTYDQAIREMEKEGIPLTIAVRALNRVYPSQYRVTKRGLKQTGIKQGLR